MSTPTPIRLTFLVRALDYGGAQRQLICLAKVLDKERFRVSILTFYRGALEAQLADSGVQLISLDKRGRWDIFGFLGRLIRQVRRDHPDVIHGYLDIPNLLALFLKLFVRTRVVWGVRASTIELGHYDWLHRLAADLERRFARSTDLIIINSTEGLERHVARGFPRAKMLMIPNGIDTEVFQPDSEAGQKLRRTWGVPPQTKLVGIVGRLDPMKDHQTFLRAAALVSHRREYAAGTPDSGRADILFVCVGDGPAGYRAKLEILAGELGIAQKLTWQNATPDVAAVYNALDVLVSASRAEGLSNVVGEAMACAVPCVVTDVGDSRWLVGESGIVVAPEDPEALAEGMLQCLASNQADSGGKARARIIENFSTQRLAQLTGVALFSLAGAGQHP